jgi:hypothetical protein
MAVTRTSRKELATRERKKSIVQAQAETLPKNAVQTWWKDFYAAFHGIIKLLTIVAYYCVGVFVFGKMEGWPPLTCIYFTTVTVATVGYGDHHPTTSASRAFNIPYLLFGVLIVFGYCNEFARAVLVGAQDEFIYTISLKLGQPLPPERKKTARIIFSFTSVTLIILAGTLFFSSNEGWAFMDGLYWCICTATTVGYG